MGNTKGRYKKKKKATGRFFVLLSVIAICAVLIIVVMANRGGSDPQGQPSSQPVSSPTTGGDEAWNTPEFDSITDLMGDSDLAAIQAQGEMDIDKENLSVNPDLSPVWRNILLLGTDSRRLGVNTRTDTMMILSINTQNGRTKLTTLMRDMYLQVTDNNGNASWNKLNEVAYRGGPYGTIKAVNECFNMNITEYILVNFIGLQDAIDALGGISMNVTEPELQSLNHNIKEQLQMIGMPFEEWTEKRDTLELQKYGENIHLTGLQAVAFARIRNVGHDDFDRTKRQRQLLENLFEKAKGESVMQLSSLARSLMDSVETNMQFPDLLSLGLGVIQKGQKFETSGSVPIKNTYKNEVREMGSRRVSALFDVDLEANTQRLHAYIYNE